jgi:hypothetical protein
MARLTTRGLTLQAPVGQQVVQHGPADLADQVDGGGSDHPGGLDELVAGGVQGDGEAGPVGVDAGLGAGGIGHGQPQELVADQQGMDAWSMPAGVRARRTRPPRMGDFSSR